MFYHLKNQAHCMYVSCTTICIALNTRQHYMDRGAKECIAMHANLIFKALHLIALIF